MKKFTKYFSVLLAVLLCCTAFFACEKEPPTPEEFIDTVHSDSDISMLTVLRYVDENGETEYIYRCERDGQKVHYVSEQTGNNDFGYERYFDFANKLTYFQSNQKQWQTAQAYSCWEEFAEPGQLYLQVSLKNNSDPIFENDNYAVTEDRYVITQAALEEIWNSNEVSDHYGENPRFTSTFERKDGNLVHTERIESEDGTVYVEKIVTVTVKDVTVEFPAVDK